MNHLWRSEANLPDEFFGERVTICSHLMQNSPTYCANGVVFGLTDSKCGNLRSREPIKHSGSFRLRARPQPCTILRLDLVREKANIRVLGTSARKPPLSDTLLWATLSLAHPFKIEVILSKRVDVFPKQRGREAQNIGVDHLAFSAELADYIPDVQRIPSNDSVVQDRQTTERVDLIAELASPQRALLAKAEESRQVVRSLTFRSE